jgi:two-component system CheB/CheR fusion protein
MLGTAEGVGAHAELFAPANRAHKIFKKVPSPAAGSAVPSVPAGELARSGSPAAEVWSAIELQREADHLIRAQYAPPGLVVDADMQILQLRGRVGPYLDPAPGDTGVHLRGGREGLASQLRAALDQAENTRALVRREGGSVRIDGELRPIDIEVWPLKTRTIERRCYLVMFLDAGATAERDGLRAAPYPEELRQVRRLERELSATRERLLSVIDDREATNEELKSATEQILSNNVELQAMNEQLETAAAELMSSNVELATLNDELKGSNAGLSQANTDLRHVLTNLRVPVLLLDAYLRIRRFTPSITQVLSATAADVGRHVGELRSRTTAARLDALVADVIRTARGYEEEVRSEAGPSYSMRISPCRSGEDRIDGALICWFERGSLT